MPGSMEDKTYSGERLAFNPTTSSYPTEGANQDGGSQKDRGGDAERMAIIDDLIARQIAPKARLFASLKNRILVSTLLVVIGAVVVMGVVLQLTIFPKLRGDANIITNLKALHFGASVAIIVLSWLFIERISKTIASPLLELTKRADEISRGAGPCASAVSAKPWPPEGPEQSETLEELGQDEIERLTRSFDRMLAHLKASETMLRESEEKYRFLFDNGPSPIFVIDAETLQILDLNARAEEEYQFTRDEFLSMTFSDLGMQSNKADTDAQIRKLLTSDHDAPMPVIQHKRKDGSMFMVNFHARMTRFRDRPAIIAAVWDVTETLEKHAKLIQAGKMATLGEMATGIAHELNQPLDVIMLGCDFIGKRLKRGHAINVEDLQYVTEEISASVQRASKIINHLRQFGRKTDAAMNPVDIREAITNVFGLVGRQLAARGIEWELDFPENAPKIMGDLNRLEQVFINLVLNARDAMVSSREPLSEAGNQKPKRITIKLFTEADRLVVIVSDTGPGIPENLLEKVFDPFFTTKKPGEGTGLGLSITYGIVKNHKGAVEVDSAPGKGATFKLTFPIVSTEIPDDKDPSRG
ncbi:MAG: ATP-binding protein [Desulfomonilaceae bacterium]